MTHALARSEGLEHGDAAAARSQRARRFREVRACTAEIVAGLSAEDLGSQLMALASPGKWHLAHTTWFFDLMLLAGGDPAKLRRPAWHAIHNSYYRALGGVLPQIARAMLTRPSLDEVLAWRAEVDDAVAEAIARGAVDRDVLELGLNHEQQHQELLVTDLKHLFAQNPLEPAWHPAPPAPAAQPAPWHWIEHAADGAVAIGDDGEGFAYDNERPRHRVWLAPFALASRPVTNAEYLAFIDDGGYRRATLWLSDGWDRVEAEQWQAPLYWRRDDGGWRHYTVYGVRAVDPAEPVAHLSYYEADAYARWSGARLPTEFEWEAVATRFAPVTSAAASPHPQPPAARDFAPRVWQWTASAYAPYPGFTPFQGIAAEYNGKFMSGQMVLRGGSCATPPGHLRPTYRNFFAPACRWQFSGLRLARDLAP